MLTEIEVEGPATVAAIRPCGNIDGGPGNVVTGRFVTRQAGNLLEVQLVNGTTFVGTTAHPVWLPTLRQWKALSEIQAGDELDTHTGQVAVATVRNANRVSDVFNIEVHGHHVYRISSDGILVHNNSSVGKELIEDASRSRAESQTGRTLTQSKDTVVDFEDELGRTYDTMGNPDTVPHWPDERNNFMKQIDKHLSKADYAIIDLTGFPQYIKDEVSQYVLNFPEELFDRIIPIGL